MDKVLIVTPKVYYDSIAYGFENNGIQPEPLFYGIHANKWVNRVRKWYYGNVWKQITASFNSVIERKLLLAIQQHNPKFILFIKGNEPTYKNINLLKSINIPIVLWTLDSLERFPTQAPLMDLAKHVFVQDGIDTKSSNTTWLPLGFDERHFKIDHQKELDVLLIGNIDLPNYANRNAVLNQLLSDSRFDSYKIGFAGPAAKYPDLIQKMRSKANFKYTPRLNPEAYAKYISKSTICINLHQNDGNSPVNPTFFGIAGAGVCQISDDRSYLSRWLTPHKSFLPSATNEVLENALLLLKNPDLVKEISNNATIEAAAHTYTSRARTILNTVEL